MLFGDKLTFVPIRFFRMSIVPTVVWVKVWSWADAGFYCRYVSENLLYASSSLMGVGGLLKP